METQSGWSRKRREWLIVIPIALVVVMCVEFDLHRRERTGPENWTVLPMRMGESPKCPREFPVLLETNGPDETFTCGTEEASR
jgi:hypothetical protein